MIPTDQQILDLLDGLETQIADDLESKWLDFKPWIGPKEDMKLAAEYAVCFTNAEGGVVVFGVRDKKRGRTEAIQGVGKYELDKWQASIFQATKPGIDVELSELDVPEGTGKLLVMRVQPSDELHGTSQGLYKVRIGKNCMPVDSQEFNKAKVSTGAVDWSGQSADGVVLADLDKVEIARGRNILRAIQPTSDLLNLNDEEFLIGLGVIRKGAITNAGMLLFGTKTLIDRVCPQHQVHYVLQKSETEVLRNDSHKFGLLDCLQRIEQAFDGPSNPETEVSVGLLKLRIPSYPIDVIREGLLNAVTHRDYTDPGEVLIRQTERKVSITSPGGFLGGITPENILRQEPVSRNRTLAEAFEKLRLVERAGVGRRRIFVPTLSYGKQAPEYRTDGTRVTLRIYDGTFDEPMALLIAKWGQEGRTIDLDSLLLLSWLKDYSFIDTQSAAKLLQLSPEEALGILDRLANPKTGILERRGKTKAATFYLMKHVARDLHGKAAYTKAKGIDPIRYEEMVRAFVKDHGSISPQECRELFGLGEAASARMQTSRLLKGWSDEETGFLQDNGESGSKRRYLLRK